MSANGTTRQTTKRLRQGTLSSLANIPEGTDTKRPRRDTPSLGTWNDEVKGLMLFEPNAWKHPNTILGKQSTQVKVAAFDLDSTLITTKSRAKFPKSASDWRLLNSRVASIFSSLATDDFIIVIFTNQAGVTNGRITESFVKTRVEGILAALKVDVGVFVATGKDNYRKPATGMWDLFVQMIGGAERIDTEKSFYVGDAAGRPAKPGHSADYSDSDLKYSINIGLPFKTPEQYFQNRPADGVSTDSIKGFDPRAMVASSETPPTYIDEQTDMDMLLRRIISPAHLVDELQLGSSSGDEVPAAQVMVLMHGFPASGKTSFVRRYLRPRGYVWVNQDSVHTYSRCVRAARDGLASGKSVVIDNTNPDRNARAKYIEIGKAHDPNLKIICLVMKTSREVAQHLNILRERETMGTNSHVPAVAYHAFQKRVQAPEESERFDRIGYVQFLPCFNSDKEKYMFTRLS